MKAVVAAFNQEKALVGAFSVITNLRMELFQALVTSRGVARVSVTPRGRVSRLHAAVVAAADRSPEHWPRVTTQHVWRRDAGWSYVTSDLRDSRGPRHTSYPASPAVTGPGSESC